MIIPGLPGVHPALIHSIAITNQQSCPILNEAKKGFFGPPRMDHMARIRVRDRWHFQYRLIRKVLAHTVGVFLNLQLGRQPLDVDGILMV